MKRLWHFTCDHGNRGLGLSGRLRPLKHPMMPELPAAVWLTDDPSPSREDVGLSSKFLSCDRILFRYKVIRARRVMPWSEVRGRVSVDVVTDLESFSRPASWWLSFGPVKVKLSQISEAARERCSP